MPAVRPTAAPEPPGRTVPTPMPAVPTPNVSAPGTPTPESRDALQAPGGTEPTAASTEQAAPPGGGFQAVISPLFWDENAVLNGVKTAHLTIHVPKFSLDRGRPGETEMDWGQAPGPAVFVMLLDQLARILLPHANANAMAQEEPNVHADIYFNSYHSGVRIPGLVFSNDSDVPVWVEGAIVGSALGETLQVPADSDLGGFVPPVVVPGETRIVQFTPADMIRTIAISPCVDVSVLVSAEGVGYTLNERVASLGVLDAQGP